MQAEGWDEFDLGKGRKKESVKPDFTSEKICPCNRVLYKDSG